MSAPVIHILRYKRRNSKNKLPTKTRLDCADLNSVCFLALTKGNTFFLKHFHYTVISQCVPNILPCWCLPRPTGGEYIKNLSWSTNVISRHWYDTNYFIYSRSSQVCSIFPIKEAQIGKQVFPIHLIQYQHDRRQDEFHNGQLNFASCSSVGICRQFFLNLRTDHSDGYVCDSGTRLFYYCYTEV